MKSEECKTKRCHTYFVRLEGRSCFRICSLGLDSTAVSMATLAYTLTNALCAPHAETELAHTLTNALPSHGQRRCLSGNRRHFEDRQQEESHDYSYNTHWLRTRSSRMSGQAETVRAGRSNWQRAIHHKSRKSQPEGGAAGEG